ncbi:hypothetical protein LSH36_1206g00041 [Paralvinella palmiformis]|uniref:protein-tyrosine-phosphatase n=1 Tax=Paralvinella palmiformis TaxID=53620 RepID=A0AAD9MPS3_9ANNE|nr:hypothetical protein LSH36_1206g00041 [Paralvinella palmiformis]
MTTKIRALCSYTVGIDGIGRTGTFIALDILIQQMVTEKVVDIEGCVWKLRNQRVNVVETKEQYVFLYDAILEATIAEKTSFPLETYPDYLDSICTSIVGGKTKLHRQFKVFRRLVSRAQDKNITTRRGLAYTNVSKNRDPYIVPDDHDRPYLSTPYLEGNDYVNAVYVDHERMSGLFTVKHYQLLDWDSTDPLPSDTESFLELIDIIQRTVDMDTYRGNDKILIQCL